MTSIPHQPLHDILHHSRSQPHVFDRAMSITTDVFSLASPVQESTESLERRSSVPHKTFDAIVFDVLKVLPEDFAVSNLDLYLAAILALIRLVLTASCKRNQTLTLTLASTLTLTQPNPSPKPINNNHDLELKVLYLTLKQRNLCISIVM